MYVITLLTFRHSLVERTIGGHGSDHWGALVPTFLRLPVYIHEQKKIKKKFCAEIFTRDYFSKNHKLEDFSYFEEEPKKKKSLLKVEVEADIFRKGKPKFLFSKLISEREYILKALWIFTMYSLMNLRPLVPLLLIPKTVTKISHNCVSNSHE